MFLCLSFSVGSGSQFLLGRRLGLQVFDVSGVVGNRRRGHGRCHLLGLDGTRGGTATGVFKGGRWSWHRRCWVGRLNISIIQYI